jgi:hypothetical protein
LCEIILHDVRNVKWCYIKIDWKMIQVFQLLRIIDDDWLQRPKTRELQGKIQDFKLGGGGALKKIAPSGGRLENFWGISCENSRFYAKKSYFFQMRRETWTFLGYFVWKIMILCQQIIFFPILGTLRAPPPLGSAPELNDIRKTNKKKYKTLIYYN